MLSLKVVRLGKRIIRRVFGKDVPHWLKDSGSLFKYINVFRLIPTLQVLICAPSHFFKSIPAILKGKKAHYVSPLQFLSNIIIVQIALLSLLYEDEGIIDKTILLASNLVLIFFGPVLMVAASVALLTIWFLCNSIWPLNLLTKEIEFNYHGLLIPLSPATYKALNWGRFLWSMFYCYMYFYVAFGILSMLFVGGGALLFDAYALIGNGHVYINKLTIIPFGIGGLLVFFAGYWFFVRPYVSLLLYSVKHRTHRMERYLLAEVSSAYL